MDKIHSFLKNVNPTSTLDEKIAESGSGRINYRFKTSDDSFILTYNENLKENESFFYLSNLFRDLNGFVPDVFQVSKDKTMYVQEDLGDENLLELRLKNPQAAQEMYAMVVKKLVHLQVGAHQIIDYNKTSGSSSFDTMLVLRDLFYFKNYFLDLVDIDYSQSELLAEFEQIANAIAKTKYRYFMFRDFQGRNIMLHNEKTYFIDFQDGMEGPIAYDLVSLLWQAKAELSDTEKQYLYKIYTSELKKLIPNLYDDNSFQHDYQICVLIRLLQVVGAYGKLGIMQQKEHFRESLKFGIMNLNKIAASEEMKNYPVLKLICASLNIQQIPNTK